MSEDNDKLRELVAQVTAAYFSHAHVNAADIPHVMSQITASLSSVGQGSTSESGNLAGSNVSPQKLTPAQVRKSITHEALISFEDGKRYKTLKRHLAIHGLTPTAYREKWGLPHDYPMVAASYSATRSALAKSLGLGQKGFQRGRKATPSPRKAAKA